MRSIAVSISAATITLNRADFATVMGTNEQVMAWFMDTYSMYQGRTVTEIVTGKPVSAGGTLGRSEATGNTFAGAVRYVDAQTRSRHAVGLDKADAILEAALRYAYRHLPDNRHGVSKSARAIRRPAPLIWNALTCKHPGYQHEAEMRLVILGQASHFRGKLSKRTRNGKTVPYIPYDVRLQEPGMIAEIIIGPAAPTGTAAKVKQMLKAAGVSYPVPIRRSTIPYRSFMTP